jgi:pimeloyl-ACP methyl ester carboxylesterase
MQIERGRLGSLPYAAIGNGSPLVVLAGLSPVAGELGNGQIQGTIGPVRQLAASRRLIVLNRWHGMPPDSTMASIAAAHAQALRTLPTPVDVLGLSTGGSIAQQLAADHPDTVRRLGLISTGCRLGPTGARLQARVASLLRAGAVRQAGRAVASALVPRPLSPVAAAIGWAVAGRAIAPDQIADLISTIDAEDRFDLAGCSSAIGAPTLLVAGGRDRFYSAELFRQTVALIPGARLALYPRRGHLSVCWDRGAQAVLAGFFR